MGAQTFADLGTGATAEEAFYRLVEQAQYDYGHAGYTGTIAEKHEFVVIEPPPGLSAFEFLEQIERYDPYGEQPQTFQHAQLVERAHEIHDDKWGPALCIPVRPTDQIPDHIYPRPSGTQPVWLFCGWASS